MANCNTPDCKICDWLKKEGFTDITHNGRKAY